MALAHMQPAYTVDSTVLEMEFRSSAMLGKRPTTKLYPTPKAVCVHVCSNPQN